MKFQLLLIVTLAVSVASLPSPKYHHRRDIRSFRGGDSLTTKVASNLVEQSIKDVKESLMVWGWKDIVFASLAVLAAATSSTAMVIEASLLVSIVGFLCISLGVSSVVLQKKLSEFETMRELTNQMKDQVSNLSETNDKLKKENSRLDESTMKLQKAESDLASISAAQGVSIDKLVEQVNEYRVIQNQVKEDLKTKIKQTLLSVVMRSDVDRDYQIDPEEIDIVVLRLSSLPNVKFNESRFRKAIKKDNGSLVTFMNDHLSEDMTISKDKIFVF